MPDSRFQDIQERPFESVKILSEASKTKWRYFKGVPNEQDRPYRCTERGLP